MRIYTDREGWTEWKFQPKAVNEDVSVLRAWAERQIRHTDAAFHLARHNGWKLQPTTEQFKKIAEGLGYYQWTSPYDEGG